MVNSFGNQVRPTHDATRQIVAADLQTSQQHGAKHSYSQVSKLLLGNIRSFYFC